MDSRIVDKSRRNTVSLERCTVRKYRGTAMVSSTPMMLMTTSSSIRVNPRRRGNLAGLPLTIRDPVQSLSLRQGIHIEHIVARLRIGWRTLVAAQSPGIRRGRGGIGKHRIARHAPQ